MAIIAAGFIFFESEYKNLCIIILVFMNINVSK